MKASPKVAIVILNWNGRKFLEQFLPSVLLSTYQGYELIVADNGSSDDSLSFLADQYPAISIIKLEKNWGFAQGYNEALKQVEADYYILLNSDVEVTPGWIEPMVELLESNLTIAACQPKLLAYNNKNLFEYAGACGGWIDKYGYPFSKGRLFEVCEEDRGQYDKQEPIFWASGAAMFIRAKVYHELKGFDGFFFAHQEEIDLCWRIQRAGYIIFSCPSSVVYHVGGGTLPRGNSRKTFLNYRNNHIMLSKNLPPSRWWITPYRMGLDVVVALKALLTGDGGQFIAILKAHWAFIRWRISAKKKTQLPYLSSQKLAGCFEGNIAWLHFIKKKNTFSEIVGKRV